jgi:hypothetical protein
MVRGPDGRVHDLTLTRNSGLLQLLNPEEVILADLGYIKEQILTPHKNPRNEQENEENCEINKRRVVVENVI